MKTTNEKKKTPKMPLILVFFGIVLIMIVANIIPKKVQYECAGPTGGTVRMSTFTDKLVIISQNEEVYIWDWNNLSNTPRISSLGLNNMTAVDSDRILAVSTQDKDSMTIIDLNTGKELKRFWLYDAQKCTKINPSHNGKYVIAELPTNATSGKEIKFAVINVDSSSTPKVIKINSKLENFSTENFAVTNDGSLVAIVGGNKNGAIILVDTLSRKILWEKTVDKSITFNKVIFSQDGSKIYASQKDRFVYVFECKTSEIVKKLEIAEYKTPANNPQIISCLTVSGDDSLFAASSGPGSQVYIWDAAKNWEKIDVLKTGHFMTSGISFSPDNTLIAIADSTVGPLKFCKISGKD